MGKENRMKYRTLRWVARCLGVLVWVVLVVGVFTSIVVGIAAATVMAKVGILLGGLVITAINALILLAASRFIYLFIYIEQDLSDIKELIKSKQ